MLKWENKNRNEKKARHSDSKSTRGNYFKAFFFKSLLIFQLITYSKLMNHLNLMIKFYANQRNSLINNLNLVIFKI